MYNMMIIMNDGRELIFKRVDFSNDEQTVTIYTRFKNYTFKSDNIKKIKIGDVYSKPSIHSGCTMLQYAKAHR